MKKTTQKKKKRDGKKKERTSSKPKPGLKATKPVSQEKRENKRPVPLKKAPVKREEEKQSLFRFVGIAGKFLREAKIELKKVKWPTRKELFASTAIVVVLVLIISFFLGLIDFGLVKAFKYILG